MPTWRRPRARYDQLADLLANDPLVGLARNLQPTKATVQGADAIVAAAGDLFGAAGDGMAIGRRFVEIKEAQAADPAGGSALSQLVELVATSHERELRRIAAAIASAQATLDAVPDGLVAPLEQARDALSDEHRRVRAPRGRPRRGGGPLPAILGWDAPRRYLVLTQNPAELRPTGGYTGSYGIIAFDKGRITEATFQDIYQLDLPWDYPFITPPRGARGQPPGASSPGSWRTPTGPPTSPPAPATPSACTRTSPATPHRRRHRAQHLHDRPTAQAHGPGHPPGLRPDHRPRRDHAQADAGDLVGGRRRLHEPQGRPGPLRAALFAALLGLPPKSWSDLAGDVDTYRRERLLLAWFKDPAAQAMVVENGFDGAVRQDTGDYVYPVDSNVAPDLQAQRRHHPAWTSTCRSTSTGTRANRLTVTWDNGIEGR